MCSSFTWGVVSVHYLLGLTLAYALRNGLMLLVKLTYSPVLLRPIESSYLPKCSHPFNLHFGSLCAFSSSLSQHTVLLCPTPLVYVVAVAVLLGGEFHTRRHTLGDSWH